MRKLGKKVTLDKRSLQAYKFCVCSNCPCPSGTSSYSAKAYLAILELQGALECWHLTQS